LGNLLTQYEKLESKWAKLEKLELEILEKVTIIQDLRTLGWPKP
jgi:hypothetical protein